jgi:hypothetical protein
MILEHKAIDADNEETFRTRLNAASKQGWVLSSQFGVSMVVDPKTDKVIKCFHIMVSKALPEKPLKAVKTPTNVN